MKILSQVLRPRTFSRRGRLRTRTLECQVYTYHHIARGGIETGAINTRVPNIRSVHVGVDTRVTAEGKHILCCCVETQRLDVLIVFETEGIAYGDVV